MEVENERQTIYSQNKGSNRLFPLVPRLLDLSATKPTSFNVSLCFPKNSCTLRFCGIYNRIFVGY